MQRLNAIEALKQSITPLVLMALLLAPGCTSGKDDLERPTRKNSGTACEEKSGAGLWLNQEPDANCVPPEEEPEEEEEEQEEQEQEGSGDGSGTGSGSTTLTDDPPPPAPDFLAGIKAMTDQEAVPFIVEECAGCHDSKDGSVRSFWPLDKDQFTKAALAVDTMAPAVYWSLYAKAKEIIGSKPAAMPPVEVNAEKLGKIKSLLKWMQVEMPSVAQEARTRFGGGDDDVGDGVGVVFNFKCDQPASFREYVRRVTNDAFNREPTAEELALNGTAPDEPTTPEDRVKVASRLFEHDSWKAEFTNVGLKKFADKISGANAITPYEDQLTAEQVADIKLEFYELLKRKFEAESYKDILLSDTVMVTANTAALYECPVPATPWAECTMTAPRGSYFTTYGYLRSKESSFLRENNNYGRSALMYFIVRGDVFKAAFDQSGGAETVRDLPTCLKTNDWRGKKSGTATAWQGAAAIPSSANLCQSCHIERQMASGSMLFRPFNAAGHIYGAAHPVQDDPDFAVATAPEMINVPGLTGTETPVDLAFLESLLTSADEESCVPAGKNTAETKLANVKDLAAWMIGEGRVLAGGLSRHIPRAISNLPNTSEEIIIRINNAFTQGGGKLVPVFKAYFASETYACKR